MRNALAHYSAIDTYRSIFSERVKTAADMSLHELVDEFARLTEVIKANTTRDDDGTPTYTEAGHLAIKERQVFASVASARFGISLASDDGTYPDVW
ncbi:MAG: hypothetical protein ACTHKQ_00010 [Mesorhizobium sp.]